MRLEYDKRANMAYIYVAHDNAPGCVAKTCASHVEIKLDFNVGGRLVGIEILDARQLLSPETLAEADL